MKNKQSHFVEIKGEYASIKIEYDSYEEAVLGKERALNKIAFSRSKITIGEL